MYKIKTLNNIARIGLDNFDDSKYTVGDFDDADAILVRSAKMHDYKFNPELLCIARAGSGTNNIPCDACAEKGIVVFNSPGANAGGVKELVLCALLLASRDVIGGIEWVKSIADKGDEVAALVEKGKSAFVGPEIRKKGRGVIGLGAVGAKIANDATALGMTVYGYDPYLSVDAAWHLSAGVIHAKDLDTLYQKCDYITIHVPYMTSTHHTINAEALAKMKDGVRIINLARAELVDDDAMLEAIKSGKVARYVTDFPNAKTAGAEGIIAIPHLGASTPESEDNCAIMAVKEVVDYIERGNISNSVNMPAATMPYNGDCRICIIHKNIPEMISRITSAVSSYGLNIENMVNAGKKNFANAYTMIDVPSVAEGLEDALKAIDGVVRVRIIK